MLPEQRHLVQSSWALAAARGGELARRFYARLFEIDGGAARLFAGVDMAAQHRKFADMLAAIVGVLDDPDAMVPRLAALGRRHAGYGVHESHYAAVGEALLHALSATLGDALPPDARAAWAHAYALIGAVMRRATTHQHSLSQSVPHQPTFRQ